MHETIKKLSDNSFEKDIQGSDLILVDFYAEWCGPCQMMAPVLETLSRKLQGRLTVAQLDIDASPQIASAKAVYSVPTLILFRKGEEIGRMVGFNSEQAVLSFINSHTK
jgi:thioredoxin 1